MEGSRRMKQLSFVLGCLIMASLLIFALADDSRKTPFRKLPRATKRGQTTQSFGGVKLHRHGHHHSHHHGHDRVVVMDNGLARVTLSVPEGDVVGIEYNGIDNLLHNPAHWDIDWAVIDQIPTATFKIIVENEDQVELSFSSRYNVSRGGNAIPLNIDKRFIMLRGSSGFYHYAILEKEEGWPGFGIGQMVVIFQLRYDKFYYMALSDTKQRIMPAYGDRAAGHQLAYKEAVLVTTPSNTTEVDDKYMYSRENKDNKVHGWVSKDPYVGFWIITPSDEFRVGGPHKLDLTSHMSSTTLCMFGGTHYAGSDLSMNFEDGEAWKKVYGPIFVYLNSDSNQNPRSLWEDAKEQMKKEEKSWPYSFPKSEDFPSSDQRGRVTGQLQVFDPYINPTLFPAAKAWVGLTLPGAVGSWQKQTKGYQFWIEANENGSFIINNIRPGTYNLYAWVPGIIGDYKYENIITIEAGDEIKLNNLVYQPPRQGPTLWEIGIPDRKSLEFYVPEPYPNLMNSLFTSPDERFRQYGIWDRYADLYPHQDLIYTVGVNNYTKDWFYAHVTRRLEDNTYVATTWQIKFQLEDLNQDGYYTLQLALASASYSEVQVRFNDPTKYRPHFTTHLIGRDNAIARHGSHGLYWLYSITVSGRLLVQGSNIIYLTQSRGEDPFRGVMYDYIRLEGPPRVAL